MNVKKEVVDRISKMLKNEQIQLRSKLFLNRRNINHLAKESTIMKRELAKLDELIALLPENSNKVGESK